MKLVESNLPDSTYVKIRHFHQGNSSRRKRGGKLYVTEVTIHDKDDHRPLAVGKSRCSKLDCPQRDTGRHIAVGRAMRMLLRDHPERFSERFYQCPLNFDVKDAVEWNDLSGTIVVR